MINVFIADIYINILIQASNFIVWYAYLCFSSLDLPMLAVCSRNLQRYTKGLGKTKNNCITHKKKKTALYLIPDAILLKIALVISFSREILMAVFLWWHLAVRSNLSSSYIFYFFWGPYSISHIYSRQRLNTNNSLTQNIMYLSLFSSPFLDNQ